MLTARLVNQNNTQISSPRTRNAEIMTLHDIQAVW